MELLAVFVPSLEGVSYPPPHPHKKTLGCVRAGEVSLRHSNLGNLDVPKCFKLYLNYSNAYKNVKSFILILDHFGAFQ